MSSRGSSRRIVPAPTMIASAPARWASTRSRSAPLERISRAPPPPSRQPSTDIAQLSSTYGRSITGLAPRFHGRASPGLRRHLHGYSPRAAGGLLACEQPHGGTGEGGGEDMDTLQAGSQAAAAGTLD